MLAPKKNVVSRRAQRAKFNRSSRTKTATKDRKRGKKKQTLNSVRKKVQAMVDSNELLFPKLFDDASVNVLLQELDSEEVTRRVRVYSIPVTLSLFVQQVLSHGRGCKEIVTLLNQGRKAAGLSEVSTNTTSYCEARHRIPLQLIKKLTQQTAQLASSGTPENWRWRGHRVTLVDGLVVNAPDMPDNQEKYPQPSSQKAGLGFPQIRVCAAICLSTGVVTEVQYAPVEGKKTGEATLFRQMFPGFKQGDIVVADSNFECYRNLAVLGDQGVYMVCNKNGNRTSPFTGACQTLEDKIVTLSRPGLAKSGYTREDWEKLPATMDVRMIRYSCKGRTPEITIVTTLIDTEAYPPEAIAKLYKHRWACELDIRSIKAVLGMTWLSCHTPEMLERELMVYFLAYNIVRVTICDAARIAECEPRDVSFKNAKDSWLHFGQDSRETNDAAWLLWSIGDSLLRKRARASEPRKIKRRNNKYEKMKLPRDQEKQALPP